MFTIIIIIIIRIIITYYHNFDILAFIFFFLLSSSSSFSLFHLLSSTSIYMICSVLFLFLLSSSFAVSALLSISYLLSLLFILVVNRKWDYSAITSWILTLIVFFVSFFSFSFFFVSIQIHHILCSKWMKYTIVALWIIFHWVNSAAFFLLFSFEILICWVFDENWQMLYLW